MRVPDCLRVAGESVHAEGAIMKVTAVQKIEALTKSLQRVAHYREHDFGCEVHNTDFCTCGLKQAMDDARAAVALEVES